MASLLDMRLKLFKEFAAHPRISGLRCIGHGFFSVIYAQNAASVIKMTVDPATYALLTDPSEPKHPLFPRVIKDHGIIGDYDGRDVVLLELERLVPLETGSAAYRTVRRICRMYHDGLDERGGANSLKRTICDHMYRRCIDPQLGEALWLVAGFVESYGCSLDMYVRNFMHRQTTRELVLSDLVADI